MRSGKLSRVIVIERASTIINAAGTPSSVWTDHATLRAEVVRLSTAEVIRGLGGAVDERSLIIRTRFLAGLTNADRVRFDGRTYNIKEAIPIDGDRGLELRAEAIEASA